MIHHEKIHEVMDRFMENGADVTDLLENFNVCPGCMLRTVPQDRFNHLSEEMTPDKWEELTREQFFLSSFLMGVVTALGAAQAGLHSTAFEMVTMDEDGVEVEELTIEDFLARVFGTE